MEKRIQWIDIAKGLGAIYVMLGHFILTNKIAVFIYAFHMPLFFLLTGVTFKIKEDESFGDFFIKKFKTIMIPYFIFSIPIFIYNTISIIHNGNDIMPKIIQKVIGIFLCWKTQSLYNGVWFLPCMFFAYIIAFFVLKHIKNKSIILISVVVALIIGVLCNITQVTLPWGIDTAFIAYAFLGMGYVYKDKLNNAHSWCWLLYIPMIVVAYINYKVSGVRVEMYSNDYGNIVLFCLASLLGSVATISLAKTKMINKIPFMGEIGKESMYLYGAQLLFFSIISKIAIKVGLGSFNILIVILVGVIVSCVVFITIWFIKPSYYKLYNKIIKK